MLLKLRGILEIQLEKDTTVAKKHLLQTTAFFLLAYGLAPWVSKIVINHFNPDVSIETASLHANDAPLRQIPLTETNSLSSHADLLSSNQKVTD